MIPNRGFEYSPDDNLGRMEERVLPNATTRTRWIFVVHPPQADKEVSTGKPPSSMRILTLSVSSALTIKSPSFSK